MPLQNRVTPTGDILAVAPRGLFMGNRGVLHDDLRRLGAARWKHRNWVTCRLNFNNRRRQLMTPRRYTELFFLDEAVALAAGHRPCGECRHGDYQHFLELWAEAHGHRPTAKALDDMLHMARAEPGARRLKRHTAALEGLPDGAFVLADSGQALLVAGEHTYPYEPGGYGAPLKRWAGTVRVLTPSPTIAVLRVGFRPVLHPSALSAAPRPA